MTSLKTDLVPLSNLTDNVRTLPSIFVCVGPTGRPTVGTPLRGLLLWLSAGSPTLSIIMMAMFRVALFVLVLLLSTVAIAQTPPPGAPYDASKHPNPIVTFVEEKDFKPVTYDEAKKSAEIELLGLAQDEAKQQSVELADGRFVKNMPILNFRTDVTFYPVIRQKFKLSSGSDVALYSFRFPKVALPRDYARMVLNEAAIEKKKKRSEMRFGGN